MHLGFLSDEEKWDALAAAELLVMPSRLESLSMVTLEAWWAERPVLVNGKCEVLRGQSRRANAGLYYTSYDEFREALALLESDAVAARRAWAERPFVLREPLHLGHCREEVSAPARARAPREDDGASAQPAQGRPGAAAVKPAVHQLLAALSYGDAISNEALAIQAPPARGRLRLRHLRRGGAPALAHLARPLWRYRDVSAAARVPVPFLDRLGGQSADPPARRTGWS